MRSLVSPRFKSASRFNTIQIEDPMDGMVKHRGRWGFVKIKGLPTIRFRWSRRRAGLGDLKSIRITRTPIGFYVSLVHESEPIRLPQSNEAVGIDMGVTDRMTLSTGEHFDSPRVDQDAVKSLQQEIARCAMGSKSRKKKVKSLARQRYRNSIRNRGVCHEITSQLIKRFGTIVIEDLNTRGLVRSASGTVDNPGTNVKAKSGLNRRILEQTWGQIREQLSYKAEWAGRKLVSISPMYTSQRCSSCGQVDKLSRSGKIYDCRSCGLSMDSDHNAALNILRAGWDSPGAEMQKGIGLARVGHHPI